MRVGVGPRVRTLRAGDHRNMGECQLGGLLQASGACSAFGGQRDQLFDEADDAPSRQVKVERVTRAARAHVAARAIPQQHAEFIGPALGARSKSLELAPQPAAMRSTTGRPAGLCAVAILPLCRRSGTERFRIVLAATDQINEMEAWLRQAGRSARPSAQICRPSINANKPTR